MPWFDSPAREAALIDEVRRRDRQIRANRSQVTRPIAMNTAGIAERIPTVDREVVVGAALMGVPADSEFLDAIAMRSWEKDENVFQMAYSAVKGATRIAGTIAQSAYEEVISRPIRALVGQAQGIKDPYEMAGRSVGVRALEELAAGRRVNLGSGFLPNSDVATPDDPYVDALVQSGVDPDQAVQQVQSQYGTPIWQEYIEESERIKFRGMPVSPGRLAAGVFAIEPGSMPYNILSGSIDAVSQVVLDPTSKLFVGMKIPKFIPHVGGTQVVPGVSQMRQKMRMMGGVLDGPKTLRPTVFGPRAVGMYDNLEGGVLLDALWRHHDDSVSLKAIFAKGGNAHPPAKLINQILRAESRAELTTIMKGETGSRMLREGGRAVGTESFGGISMAELHEALPRNPVATSMVGRVGEAIGMGQPGTARSLGGRIGGGIGRLAEAAGNTHMSPELGRLLGAKATVGHTIDGTRLGRVFATMPGTQIDFLNLDQGAVDLDNWMNGAKFSYAERKAMLNKWYKLADADLASADFYELMFRDVADIFSTKIVRNVVPQNVAAGGKAAIKEYNAKTRVTTRGVESLTDDELVFVNGKWWNEQEFADEYRRLALKAKAGEKGAITTDAEAVRRGFDSLAEYEQIYADTYGQGNWRAWSRKAGYSDEEIADYQAMMNMVGDADAQAAALEFSDEGVAGVKAMGSDETVREMFESHNPAFQSVIEMEESTANVLVDELRRNMKMAFEDIDAARAYATADAMDMPVPGGHFTLNAAGEQVALPSAQLLAEYLNRGISLPDPRQVRRAVSKISWMVANDGLQLRAVPGMMDFYMQRIWKPLVLLRVAFPLRVQADNQLRMAVAGYDSMFRHPLDWLSWSIADPTLEGSIQRGLKGTAKLTLRKERGKTGVLIREVKDPETGEVIDEVFDIIANSKQARDAQSNLTGQLLGYSSPKLENVGEVAFRTVRDTPPGQRPHKGYIGAWGSELMQMISDEVAPRVAANVEDAKTWFKNNRKVREALADTKPKKVLVDDAAARAEGYRDAAEACDVYIDGVAARIHEKTGGKIRWTIDDNKKITYHIDVDGNADLRRAIALRRHTTAKGKKIDLSSVNDSTFADFLGDLRDNYYGVEGSYPTSLKMHDTSKTHKNVQSAADRTVRRLFEALASKPENVLSRSPVFRQTYWARMEELLPFADDAARAQILDAAKAANLEKSTIARMQKIRAKTGIQKNAIVDMEDLDGIAKTWALDKTRELLYDLQKRSNFMDIMRNVFPFGEAWVEILSRWAKLGWEHPEAGRRFQQVVEGGRRSGFISTDPVTGQEVFNYPGGGLLANWMLSGANKTGPIAGAMGGAAGGLMLAGGPGAAIGGIGGAVAGALGAGAAAGPQTDPITGTQPTLALQGQVQGINLVAASYLPGLGPLMQFPLAGILGQWGRDKPQLDWVTRQVFPFGEPKINSIDDVAKMGIPAWSQKLLQPMSTGDPDFARLHAHSSIDVMRALLQTGEYSNSTPAEMARLQADASAMAGSLSIIRGFLQFGLPTGPQVRFYTSTGEGAAPETNGQFYLFQTLASEYRQMLERNDYDDVAAYDEFWRRFGLDPTTFVTSKTTSSTRRGTTTPAYNFERINAGTFDEFPLTAYYGQPDDPDDDFDLRAWSRQLDQGTRVPYTQDQWLAARNHTLGSMAYDEIRRKVIAKRVGRGETNPEAFTDEERAYLRDAKLFYMEEYPGYARENVGVPTRGSIEQQIAELYRWDSNAVLRQTSAGRGLEVYLEARNEVMARTEALGYSPTGFQDGKLEGQGPAMRQYLRDVADWILTQPGMRDFAPIWQSILSKELNDDAVNGDLAL